MNFNGGFRCTCPEGETLNADGASCTDGEPIFLFVLIFLYQILNIVASNYKAQ